jgi:hypothetical protein
MRCPAFLLLAALGAAGAAAAPAVAVPPAPPKAPLVGESPGPRGAALAATPSHAAAPAAGPAGTYTYTISHDRLGPIGTHVATFRRDGADTIVDVRIDLDVRLAFVRLYRFQSEGREVWRGGRLVELETVTNDDGRKITVSAHAAGGKLVIEGPEGRTVADADLNTTHLWNAGQLAVSQLVEPTSGNLYDVEIADLGRDRIMSLDRRVETHKYAISGEVEGELWYAEDGTWLRMDFRKDGENLRIALAEVRR